MAVQKSKNMNFGYEATAIITPYGGPYNGLRVGKVEANPHVHTGYDCEDFYENDYHVFRLQTDKLDKVIDFINGKTEASMTDDYDNKYIPLVKALECPLEANTLSREDLIQLAPVINAIGEGVIVKNESKRVSKALNFGTPVPSGTYENLDDVLDKSSEAAEYRAELDARAAKYTDEQLDKHIKAGEHRIELLTRELKAAKERLASYYRAKDAHLESSVTAAKMDRSAAVDSEFGSVVKNASKQASAEADVVRPV